MNLESINTVEDLINQNVEEPTVDDIIDSILEEDETTEEDVTVVDKICHVLFNRNPDDGYDTIEKLLNGLINLHQEVLTDKIEQEDTESVVFWSKDLQNLRTMLHLLNEITR